MKMILSEGFPSSQGTFSRRWRITSQRMVVKAYFTNMSTGRCLLLTIPALAIAYPVVTLVVPAIIRAVVPEVVRSVLSLI